MLPKLLQTALIYIINHARRTPRNLPSFLQTFDFAAAVGEGFAVHEVVIVGFAAGADEVGCAEQGRGGGAEFFDFGDVGGERGCVDEDVLVEPGRYISRVVR